MRQGFSSLLFASLLLIQGCSDAARRFDREYVGKGIQERTGHPVAPEKEISSPQELKGSAEAAAELPPTVDLTDGLEGGEAVEIALWRNAELAALFEELGIARADLLQAGLLRNPSFDLLFPFGKKELEATVNFPIELSGQLFFRRKAAALDLEAAAQTLIHAGVDLAARVKEAYAEVESVLLRIRRQDEIVRLFEGTERLSEVRHRSGETGGQELRLARLESLRARGDRDRLTQDLAVARERLNLLMGFEADRRDWQIRLPAVAADAADRPPPPAASRQPPADPRDLPSAEDLVKFALEHRLDARAAELEAEAAAERIGLARSSALPVIGALLDVKGDRFGPGISSEIPVFDFNQAGIARSRARFQVAARKYIALRDRVAAEVREALENLAGERRRTDFFRGDLIPRAEEAVRAARRSFDLGEESFLVVLEISRKLAEAERDLAESAFRLRSAEIRLERSLGGKMPPESSPPAGGGARK